MSAKTFTAEDAQTAKLVVVGEDKGRQAVHDLVTAYLVAHFIGLCLLFGSMVVVDLRVLGLFKAIPLARVFSLMPFALMGFAISESSGFLLFAVRPVSYWENSAFEIKLALLLASGLNALFFILCAHRMLMGVPEGRATPALVQISAACSLSLWLAIIFCGRLIAFQI